ncbi:MAG: hypothetical protein Q8P90_00525 [bacterium]|nr:hypothetical protein [bacterium]
MKRSLLILCFGIALSGCSNIDILNDSTSDDYYGITLLETTDLAVLPNDVNWAIVFPGPFRWGAIQTNSDDLPADWHWEEIDKLVADAKRENIELVGIIWPYAEWDQVKCHSSNFVVPAVFSEIGQSPYSPCDEGLYKNFLHELVERYTDDIHYWEITDSPSLQQPPLARFIGTPEEYTKLLEVSYQAIKEANADAYVLNGGIAGLTSESIAFWGPQFETGIADYIDILNIQESAQGDEISMSAYHSWFDIYQLDKITWITRVSSAEKFDSVDKVFYTQRYEN